MAMNINADYVKWAGVLMESIMMKNSWLKNNLCFHLLTDAVTDSDKEKLKRFSEKWDVTIHLYFMNDNNVEKFSRFRFNTRNGKVICSIHYRWLIPYLLDDEIEKVLYLDVDTVCNRNILDIFDESFEKPLLVVCDIEDEAETRRLKLKSGHYFSTGLIYMNLNKMREEKVSEKVIQYLYDCVVKKIDLSVVEQEAANITLDGIVDFARSSFHFPIDLGRKISLRENVQSEARKAYLIHFTWGVKPWRVEAQDFQLVKKWREAKMQSEWKDTKLVGEWDRKAYRTAARAARLNRNYLKWIKCKLLFGILHFKKMDN